MFSTIVVENIISLVISFYVYVLLYIFGDIFLVKLNSRKVGF